MKTNYRREISVQVCFWLTTLAQPQWLALTKARLQFTKGSPGRNSGRNSRQELEAETTVETLLTGLFPGLGLATFHYLPKPTCPRMTRPNLCSALLHQLAIKKCATDMDTGQTHRDSSSLFLCVLCLPHLFPHVKLRTETTYALKEKRKIQNYRTLRETYLCYYPIVLCYNKASNTKCT